jgi:predicted metal-binding protein
MLNLTEAERIINKFGYQDYKWIKSQDIVVAQWVRLKCMFGCPSYGKKAACPPNVPSVDECQKFFSEYQNVVLFHFEKQVEVPEARYAWCLEENKNLLALEREVFLAGFVKAFLLIMDECRLCENCSGERSKCKNQKLSRPGPEALAVDVYSTVRRQGYFIQVLENYKKPMNRFAFLLVD